MKIRGVPLLYSKFSLICTPLTPTKRGKGQKLIKQRLKIQQASNGIKPSNINCQSRRQFYTKILSDSRAFPSLNSNRIIARDVIVGYALEVSGLRDVYSLINIAHNSPRPFRRPFSKRATISHDAVAGNYFR